MKGDDRKMNRWKKYGNRLLTALLVSVMLIGSAVPGVFAEEDGEQTEATASSKTEEQDMNSETEDANNQAEDADEQEQSASVDAEMPQEEAGTETTETVTQNEETPYTMKVTFDGELLKEANPNESSVNNYEKPWGGTISKTLQVELSRNPGVNLDSDKRYVLCMKVSPMFYFNGLPDKSKITGADECVIKANDAPKVYTAGSRTQSSLANYSEYSGEIRIAINPTVDVITIPNVSVGYNQALSGYFFSGKSDQIITVENPLDITLVKVSQNITDLTNMNEQDKTVIKETRVDSAKLTRASIGGVVTNTSSLDGFTSSSQTMNQNVGVSSTISWAGGTSGISSHYCKSLVVVFHCPYIMVNGEKYYLKFDEENDTAMTYNMQKSNKGYRTKSIVYDEENHTITYTFEDIYLVQHQRLFYTPVFSWPSGLSKDITGSYPIEGYQWEVTENKGYTGVDGGWRGTQTLFTDGKAGAFVQDYADISLVSSANPGGKTGIAKREISNKLTRANKEDGIGILGFFDIHNDGSKESKDVKITFDFNSDDETGATYYITKVNLPASSEKNTVEYTLIDDNGNEKKGTKTYNNNGSFTCSVEELRGNNEEGYYIKSLSYITTLKNNWAYHLETAHMNRNRYSDSGLFYGYLEGKVGTKANATMTIASVDKKTPLNKNNETSLTAIETSTVSNEDYIGYNLGNVSVNDASSVSITAGSSATLKFKGIVSNEEYYKEGKNSVNGYHIFRDGIFYLCLPEGVSIAGNAQVEVEVGGKTLVANSVRRLDKSECTVDGTKAYWWEMKVKGINANAYYSSRQAFTVTVKLATDLSMSGVAWNFNNCLAIRPEGQEISWVGAGTNCRKIATINDLKNKSEASVQGLANYFKSDEPSTNNLGMNLYQDASPVNLNIARAEAKLDVATNLYIGNELADKQENAITDSNKDLRYDVTVSSNDGGRAENFSYYIPIVSTNSEVDASGWVGQKEFSLALQDAVTVTATKASQGTSNSDTQDDSAGQTEVKSDGFETYYTTEANLSPKNVRNDEVQWKTANQIHDFSKVKVTAVKIASSEGTTIEDGTSIRFQLHLKYDGSSNDFSQMAGSQIEWRSFGHYTYNRNNATTTNTYPSGSNMLRVRYKNDMTNSATKVTLDTSKAGNNPVNIMCNMPTSFKKQQSLWVKNVTLYNGTQLISSEPDTLSGSDANQKFQMYFNIDKGSAIPLLEGTKGGTWSLKNDTVGILRAQIGFSKALTDDTTARYVDITLGNDDIDIIWRVQLIRNVAAADAKDSGVTVGEQFKVPTVGKSCKITQNSAFTALYVINNYVPANRTSQKISWKKDDAPEAFPKGTSLILMEISDENKVSSYWHYTATGSETEIDLNRFVRMGATDSYQYDKNSTTGITLKYMLAVDFEDVQNVSSGTYEIAFTAIAKDDTGSDAVFSFPVILTDKTVYDLQSTQETAEESPKGSFEYNVTKNDNESDDNYSVGKSLALVLKDSLIGNKLPRDAQLEVDGQRYSRNKTGQYIIPIGTIGSGTKEITIYSDMFPDEEKTYSLTGQLYLSGSNYAKTPINGEKVSKETSFTFTKPKKNKPALKVKGQQVATAADWAQGQQIQVDLKNIPKNGSVTVTAYSGVNGGKQVTDLLSSVSGLFDIENGVGIYKGGSSQTNKLILNGKADKGTYELRFEIKDANGKAVLIVPYDIIISE